MRITERARRGALSLLAAIAVAGAATLGAASPALAEPPTSTTGKVTITKTLAGATASLPTGEDFTFTFTPKQLNEPGAATEADTPKIDAKTITIGIDKSNHIMVENSGASATLTKNLEVDLSTLKFPHAGVYAWTVTETAGGAEGYVYSKAQYVVRVYRDNEGNNTITVEQEKDDKGTGENSTKVKPNPDKPDPDTPGVDPKNPDEHKSGFIFNNAIKTGTITGTDKDLKVSKEVIGKYADRTRGFGFKLTLTKPADFEGTTAKAKVYDSATGQPAKSDQGAEITYEFTYGQEGTFTLKHGQYLQFEDGMANGTTYVLIEDGVATYTAAAKTVSGGGQPVEATYAADKQSAIASGNGVSTAGTASTKGANTNEVTNTLEDVTPTGIAISVLPYAVMVLVPVAAAAAWVVSRRRNGEGA
ncbi:MAG: hypothetical protein MR611_05390 [Coriobacteriaceae bacterium]|nr:hypothetical protein [Coriobacteriaceae bacterium]